MPGCTFVQDWGEETLLVDQKSCVEKMAESVGVEKKLTPLHVSTGLRFIPATGGRAHVDRQDEEARRHERLTRSD